MDNNTAAQRACMYATLTAVAASLVFWAFFQVSKKEPLVSANPFANDPYDVVGSIAVQAALGIGLLTLARLAHIPQGKRRYILRGNLVVLMSIAVTLATDVLAVALHPINWDTWGTALIGGLTILAICTLAGFTLLRRAVRLNAMLPAPAQPGALGEAVADVLYLAELPIRWIGARLSRRAPLIEHPYRAITRGVIREANRHPWWFAFLTSTLAGTGLFTAHFVLEGAPPSLAIGLLLVVIFLGFESMAVLGGFLILGGYLGLRPPL